MNVIKFIILSCCLLLTSRLWANPNPTPMLQQAATGVINLLKENKAKLKDNPNIVYHAVETNLLPIADVNGMARSVLGRDAWTRASAAERAAFTSAFTALVIRTYASPLANYSDERIKFLPVTGSLDNRFVRVNSLIIRSQGNNIPLNYNLVLLNGQWKIYDFSIEGVSLLQSFRSQFSQALHSTSLSALIKQIKARKSNPA